MGFSLGPVQDGTWFALGVVATLLGALIAHKVGILQITIARKAHELNVTKAVPKIGTSVQLEERNATNHPVTLLHIVTRIYNEGDLPASNLKGEWQLSCSQFPCEKTISINL